MPGGLTASDKTISALYIAGADKIFYPATAKIDNGQLVVSAKEVMQPVAVRYAFTNAGVGNLFAKAGLPVCPFRTDDWQLPPADAVK